MTWGPGGQRRPQEDTALKVKCEGEGSRWGAFRAGNSRCDSLAFDVHGAV